MRYRVFIEVATRRSFVHAAHALNLPRATASAAIRELEQAMGVRLLHRTTRHVQLTTDGEQLLERARALLAQADEVATLFQRVPGEVSGQLVVDLPSRIACRLIAPALPTLLRQHPRLRITLRATDRAIDLVREGVDCVMRIGEVADSRLVRRPIGRVAMVNCASPAYLQAHGVPQTVNDLAHGHAMVAWVQAATGREQPWEYMDGDNVCTLAMPSVVRVDHAESLIACGLAGLGLIQVPRFDVRELLAAGQLVEVLPGAPAAAMPVAVLYPHRRQRSPRLEVFIDWVAQQFALQRDG